MHKFGFGWTVARCRWYGPESAQQTDGARNVLDASKMYIVITIAKMLHYVDKICFKQIIWQSFTGKIYSKKTATLDLNWIGAAPGENKGNEKDTSSLDGQSPCWKFETLIINPSTQFFWHWHVTSSEFQLKVTLNNGQRARTLPETSLLHTTQKMPNSAKHQNSDKFCSYFSH